MELIKQTVKAWVLTASEAKGLGLPPFQTPEMVNGQEPRPQPLYSAVLFDDFRLMGLYGTHDKPSVVLRMVFNDAGEQARLQEFMKYPIEDEAEKLRFLDLYNPDRKVVRVIRNDPATKELTTTLENLKLAVAMERKADNKVLSCIRAFCRQHEPLVKHATTREILKTIRMTILCDVKLNEVLALYEAQMNDEVEQVIVD